MHEFEKKGYANSADETAKVIAAYHDLVQKKAKNNFSKDYNEAFKKLTMPLRGWLTRYFTDMKIKALIMPTSHLRNLIISML